MTELLNEGMTKEEILNVLVEAMETGKKVNVIYASGTLSSVSPTEILKIERFKGAMCVFYGKNTITGHDSLRCLSSVSFTCPYIVKPGTTFKTKGSKGDEVQTLMYGIDEGEHVYGYNLSGSLNHFAFTSVLVDYRNDMRVDIRKVIPDFESSYELVTPIR